MIAYEVPRALTSGQTNEAARAVPKVGVVVAMVVLTSAVLVAKRTPTRPIELTTEDDVVVYEKDRGESVGLHPSTKVFERRLEATVGCAAGAWIFALGIFVLVANVT